MASRDDRTINILIWNYHDDDVPAPDAKVDLSLTSLPAERVLVKHYRVDKELGNSYTAWKKMGSPQKPSAEQYQELERSGQLTMLGSPTWTRVPKGTLSLPIVLPRQGVSLIQLSW
jgi:xylan 1,4-beta-xylosidase